MIRGRDATLAEIASLGFTPPDGVTRWVGVIEEDGEVRGHICLSQTLGAVFGHDTRSWAADASGATRLWFMARRKAREWGVSEVYVHIEQEDDPMKEFWERRGFKVAFVGYKGAI